MRIEHQFSSEGPRFAPLNRTRLDDLLRRAGLDESYRRSARAVAEVLPFRVNTYVTDHLIDWAAVPDDPMFRLTFPQPGMLPDAARRELVDLFAAEAPPARVSAVVRRIRSELNPHPGGQRELNTPEHAGHRLDGLQHKYRDTVLFFPRRGQSCHAYCTYCFRWPQFVGDPALRMAGEITTLTDYLGGHPEVSDVLLTGGDPLAMSADVLGRYVTPLLDNRFEHVTTIRFGTKALSYWPHRFTTDRDAAELLRLFERIVASGRHLAIMAHFSHPRELATDVSAEAIRQVLSTGAVVRTQAPLIRGVNDAPEVWTELWRSSVEMGMVPYYMFVERDTGPHGYFTVPVARSWQVFRDAHAAAPGLARTVRGPVMSTEAGKVCVDGVAEVAGEKVFSLRFLRARDDRWTCVPFFARFDPAATWFTELTPLSGSPWPGNSEWPGSGAPEPVRR